jgi:hypothetical protein
MLAVVRQRRVAVELSPLLQGNRRRRAISEVVAIAAIRYLSARFSGVRTCIEGPDRHANRRPEPGRDRRLAGP